MRTILSIAIVIVGLVAYCVSGPPTATVRLPAPAFDSAGVAPTPKQLADQYCQTCHVLPSPDLLDKATWIQKVFPIMRMKMGLDTVTSQQLDAMQPEVRHFYNATPLLTEQMWFDIATYYIDHAPTTLPVAPRPPIAPETPLFAPQETPWKVQVPLFTHATIDPVKKLLILGDGAQHRLLVCDVNGSVKETIEMQGPPSSVVIKDGTWYVTDMANLMPHDSAAGALWAFTWKNGAVATKRKVLDTLRRPVHLNITDLDGDGTNEYVICEFGNQLGRLGYYQIDASGKRRYTLLLDRPGAIRTVVKDINNDKRPDILVLMAQAREGIVAFLNKGKGRFEQRELLTFHPAFGSSYFDVIDENGDGKWDIVITNGDNGDYDLPPFKPYHGVRIFHGNGKLQFTEDTFLPVNGAYGASVRDFDLDGDLDVVSIAYFANYERSPEEALLFWERTANGSFQPHRLAQFNAGRWLVFDVGDVDGDGDVDLIVANTAFGPGTVTEQQQQAWVQGGLPYILFKNTSR